MFNNDLSALLFDGFETACQHVVLAGLEFSQISVSASHVLELKVCATMPGLGALFYYFFIYIRPIFCY